MPKVETKTTTYYRYKTITGGPEQIVILRAPLETICVPSEGSTLIPMRYLPDLDTYVASAGARPCPPGTRVMLYLGKEEVSSTGGSDAASKVSPGHRPSPPLLYARRPGLDARTVFRR